MGSNPWEFWDYLLAALTAVLTPLLLKEGWAWLPMLADRLIERAERYLVSAGVPSEKVTDKAEEWKAEVQWIPGNVSKVCYAWGLLVQAPEIAGALREAPPGTAIMTPAHYWFRVLVMTMPVVTLLTLPLVGEAVYVLQGLPISVEADCAAPSVPFWVQPAAQNAHKGSWYCRESSSVRPIDLDRACHAFWGKHFRAEERGNRDVCMLSL